MHVLIIQGLQPSCVVVEYGRYRAGVHNVHVLFLLFLSLSHSQLQYSERIPFAIRQNAESDLALYVEGSGSEPHILFDRTLVEFSPVLPFSPGSVGEVTISNPKPYPVEVYSLSFDRQYLEEEEVNSVYAFVNFL